MPYVQNYSAPLTAIGQAANVAGSGAQQQMLNQNTIQKNQFAQNQGLQYAQLSQQDRQFAANQQYQYANLGEQQRQYDTSLSENQRQFNESQAFNQQQLDQRDQQFRTQVGQNQFNNLLNAGVSLTQQANQIAANERMAMFERQARLEQMGYASYLDTASRVYQQQNALSQQQQAQQQQVQSQLQYLDSIKGTLSPEAYAAARSQIQQRALGIQSQDPALLMSPADREAYYDDLAQLQARQTQRTVQANTGMSQQDWLDTYGTYVDGQGNFQKIGKSQADRELELKIADNEYKLAVAKNRDEQVKADAAQAKADQDLLRTQQEAYIKRLDTVTMALYKEQTETPGPNGTVTKSQKYTIEEAQKKAQDLVGPPPTTAQQVQQFSGVTGNQTESASNPFAAFVKNNAPIGSSKSDYTMRALQAIQQAPSYTQASQYANDQISRAFPFASQLPTKQQVSAEQERMMQAFLANPTGY